MSRTITTPAIAQRSITGSATSSTQVPSGTATAAASEIGITSRQLQCGAARTASGKAHTRSISTMVAAAIRGSYTAATSGM
jgi:hypothetical protein